MRRQVGVTLVEVLVAASTMGLILVGAVRCWSLSQSAYTQASVSQPSFRVAADAMDAITGQLRNCVAVYAPIADRLQAGFAPTQASPFVCAEETSDTPRVLAMAQHPGGGVDEWTCSTTASPWQAVPGTLRTVGGGATGFTLTWTTDATGHDFIEVRLTSGHGDALDTTVQVVDAFPGPGCVVPTP